MADVQRRPYVGEGADGCHRSAQIDREEADALDVLDPRRDLAHASAEAWERQAQHLIALETPRRPESEQRGMTGIAERPRPPAR